MARKLALLLAVAGLLAACGDKKVGAEPDENGSRTPPAEKDKAK